MTAPNLLPGQTNVTTAVLGGKNERICQVCERRPAKWLRSLSGEMMKLYLCDGCHEVFRIAVEHTKSHE